MNTAEAKVPKNEGDWKSIEIFLFSNGQQNSPPRKYHLRAEDLNWWDDTLNNLAQLHYGIQHQLIDLYTTDGHLINGPLELKDGAAYVAVEPPDQFIVAGYEKYLIKASRSWEKRQARKKLTVCEHDQLCCICHEKEEYCNVPCCLCPEKEEAVTPEPFKYEELRTHSGEYTSSVYAKAPIHQTVAVDYEPKLGENAPSSGEYESEEIVSKSGEYGRPSTDYKNRSSEYAPSSNAPSSPQPGEYPPKSNEYRLKAINNDMNRTEDRSESVDIAPEKLQDRSLQQKATSGEYDQAPNHGRGIPSEQKALPIEYVSRPIYSESKLYVEVPWSNEIRPGIQIYEIRTSDEETMINERAGKSNEVTVLSDKHGPMPDEYVTRPATAIMVANKAWTDETDNGDWGVGENRSKSGERRRKPGRKKQKKRSTEDRGSMSDDEDETSENDKTVSSRIIGRQRRLVDRNSNDDDDYDNALRGLKNNEIPSRLDKENMNEQKYKPSDHSAPFKEYYSSKSGQPSDIENVAGGVASSFEGKRVKNGVKTERKGRNTEHEDRNGDIGENKGLCKVIDNNNRSKTAAENPWLGDQRSQELESQRRVSVQKDNAIDDKGRLYNQGGMEVAHKVMEIAHKGISNDQTHSDVDDPSRSGQKGMDDDQGCKLGDQRSKAGDQRRTLSDLRDNEGEQGRRFSEQRGKDDKHSGIFSKQRGKEPEQDLTHRLSDPRNKENEEGRRLINQKGKDVEHDGTMCDQRDKECKQKSRLSEQRGDKDEHSCTVSKQRGKEAEQGRRLSDRRAKDIQHQDTMSEQRGKEGEQERRLSEQRDKEDEQNSTFSNQRGKEPEKGRRLNDQTSKEVGHGGTMSEQRDKESEQGRTLSQQRGEEDGHGGIFSKQSSREYEQERRLNDQRGKEIQNHDTMNKQKDKDGEQSRRLSEQRGKDDEHSGTFSKQGGKEPEQGRRLSDQRNKESEQGRRFSDQKGKDNDLGRTMSEQRGKDGEQRHRLSDQRGKQSEQRRRVSDRPDKKIQPHDTMNEQRGKEGEQGREISDLRGKISEPERRLSLQRGKVAEHSGTLSEQSGNDQGRMLINQGGKELEDGGRLSAQGYRETGFQSRPSKRTKEIEHEGRLSDRRGKADKPERRLNGRTDRENEQIRKLSDQNDMEGQPKRIISGRNKFASKETDPECKLRDQRGNEIELIEQRDVDIDYQSKSVEERTKPIEHAGNLREQKNNVSEQGRRLSNLKEMEVDQGVSQSGKEDEQRRRLSDQGGKDFRHGRRLSEQIGEEVEQRRKFSKQKVKDVEHKGKLSEPIHREIDYQSRQAGQRGRKVERGGRLSDKIGKESEQGRRLNDQRGKEFDNPRKPSDRKDQEVAHEGKPSYQRRKEYNRAANVDDHEKPTVNRLSSVGAKIAEPDGRRAASEARVRTSTNRANPVTRVNPGSGMSNGAKARVNKPESRLGDPIPRFGPSGVRADDLVDNVKEPGSLLDQQKNCVVEPPSRDNSVGGSESTAFTYISKAQQHIRRSSLSAGRTSSEKKHWSLEQTSSLLKKPAPFSGLAVPPKKLDDKNQTTNNKESPQKMSGKDPARLSETAATNEVGKSTLAGKYPHKQYTPLNIPPPTMEVENTNLERISISLMKITSDHKSFATESVLAENLINDKEIIILAANLHRSQESEITSIRLESNKRTLEGVKDSLGEIQTELEMLQQCLKAGNSKEGEHTHAYQHKKADDEYIQGALNCCCANHRDEAISGDLEENCISIINKGDVLNLRVNIEVRNGGRKTSCKKKCQRSRSLTNVTKVEKCSQITIDDDMCAQSKSIQSILNSGCFRSCGFEGHPKVVVVQCACRGRGNNPSRSDTPRCCDSKKYVVLLPISPQEDTDEGCHCESRCHSYSKKMLNSQQRRSSPHTPVKKTISDMTLQTVTVSLPRQMRDIAMYVTTKTTACQTEKQMNEFLKHCSSQISLTQAQMIVAKPSSCTKKCPLICSPICPEICPPPCPQSGSLVCPQVGSEVCSRLCGQIQPQSYPLVSPQVLTGPVSLQAYVQEAKPETAQCCSQTNQQVLVQGYPQLRQQMFDSYVQTEWCNVLLEARPQADGHYSFHLPPLHVLKYYKF